MKKSKKVVPLKCPKCPKCGRALTTPWFGNGLVTVVLNCRSCGINYPISWAFSSILEEYYNEGRKAAKQEIRDVLGALSK